MVDSWAERSGRFQEIANALQIPARRAQRDLHPPVPVRVRILWERDGEELIDTVAVAFTTRAVLVRLFDPRRATIGIWLDPTDVTRI